MEVSGRRCSRKEMCRTSQLHHQDTRWQDIGEIETDCNLSNLKKHLLRYLMMKTTMMSMMRIKLIMRSWKSKARINHLQKQQSEQQNHREDMTNMNLIEEREMLQIEKHCLSEKHVYQTLFVLRLLFLTAGNIISQSCYIEYVCSEFRGPKISPLCRECETNIFFIQMV